MPPCEVDPEGAAARSGPAPVEAPLRACAFTMPAQLAAAWAARARVRDWLESHALPPALVDDVEYVTSEAVSNAAEHAYAGGDGAIEVEAEVLALPGGLRRVRVRVRDHGRWQPVNPDPGHRGHGLAAMVALAAELVVRHHDGDGTEVVLLSAVVPAGSTDPARSTGPA
ncbi:MAG: ATP-binding protein [Pseudonocardia sp.]